MNFVSRPSLRQIQVVFLCFMFAFLAVKGENYVPSQWYPPHLNNDAIYFPSNVGKVSSRGGPSAPDVNKPGLKITKHSTSNMEEGLIFPDNLPAGLPMPDPHKTVNCTIPDLCDSYPDYPKDVITRLLKKKEYGHLFTTDVPPSVEVNPRFKESDGTQLCKAVPKTIYPKTGRNTKEDLQFIINTESYKQGVVIEVCEKDGAECDPVVQFPNGYLSQCVQKYSIKRLMAVDPKNEQPTIDNFEIPTCCVCTYTKVSVSRSKPKDKRRRHVRIVP